MHIQKYRTSASTESSYPDAVIDAFAPMVKKIGQHPEDVMPAPLTPMNARVPLEDAKQMISSAFHAFDPALGKRADAILQDPARWNLSEVPPGECRKMDSARAESETNPLPHSVINFDYDGTVYSIIYMAHEVGHSMADDAIRKAGHKGSDMPEHMDEFQAYFAQHIMYDALKQNPDKVIAGDAAVHDRATMHHYTKEMGSALHAFEKRDENPSETMKKIISRIHDRPMSILNARVMLDHLKDQPPAARQFASETLLGVHGPQNIAKVLASAGIEHTDEMEKLAGVAVKRAHGSQALHDMKPAPLSLRQDI